MMDDRFLKAVNDHEFDQMAEYEEMERRAEIQMFSLVGQTSIEIERIRFEMIKIFKTVDPEEELRDLKKGTVGSVRKGLVKKLRQREIKEDFKFLEVGGSLCDLIEKRNSIIHGLASVSSVSVYIQFYDKKKEEDDEQELIEQDFDKILSACSDILNKLEKLKNKLS